MGNDNHATLGSKYHIQLLAQTVVLLLIDRFRAVVGTVYCYGKETSHKSYHKRLSIKKCLFGIHLIWINRGWVLTIFSTYGQIEKRYVD